MPTTQTHVMRKRILYIITSAIAVTVQAQELTPAFSHEVKRATGDLNNDGLEDMAIVTQDTNDVYYPYRLQVWLQKPGGRHVLTLSTDKAIIPRYPDGKGSYATGIDFDDITIERGVLTIGVQLLRGYYKHKFRYQSNRFVLIGFTIVNSDGLGSMLKEDFNLLTGVRLRKEERYDRDETISNTRTKKHIRPLPDLQDFVPLENEYY